MSPKTVLITGASSGLGAALALAYAEEGVTLYLGGRHARRLAKVASAARAKGARTYEQVVDVTDEKAMADWIYAAAKSQPPDLVIANAGISGGTHKGGSGGHASGGTMMDRAVFKTNVEGVLNTILPVIPLMKERKSGQIALMASMASFQGMAGAAAYCGSKAAVRLYGEALRGELAMHGIGVHVICPGFVKTPMTEINRCAMPFLMKSDKAARLIKKALEKNKGLICFPWEMKVLVSLYHLLPRALRQWGERRYFEKEARKYDPSL